jgi:nucleotide-binding universal stress UspA family protein
MWDMEPRKILVAVDSTGSEAALRYAVAEARRRGCGIHVVHVDRIVIWSNVVDEVSLVEGELRHPGALVLAAAAASVERMLDEQAPDDGRLSVSTELTHGSVVSAIEALSRHACLAVLEHAGMGDTGETPTLSVTAGVAAAAHCPVVSVPPRWCPGSDEVQTVVVGVEDPARDTALVEAALHEAQRRSARLLVVRAPADGAPRQPDVLDVGDTEVEVDVVVQSGPAAQVLLERSAHCALVVAGRHHRKHVVGAPLGRTVRELLRQSPAPVMVVDPVMGDHPMPDSRRPVASSSGG